MNEGMKIALVGAFSAVIGGSLVAVVDYVVREREINVKMVEIAVGLLKEDPNGPLQSARKWAVQVIDDNSDTPLTEDARIALTNCRIDPSDKFGLIGRAAIEAGALGLEGGQMNLPGTNACLHQIINATWTALHNPARSW